MLLRVLPALDSRCSGGRPEVDGAAAGAGSSRRSAAAAPLVAGSSGGKTVGPSVPPRPLEGRRREWPSDLVAERLALPPTTYRTRSITAGGGLRM